MIIFQMNEVQQKYNKIKFNKPERLIDCNKVFKKVT